MTRVSALLIAMAAALSLSLTLVGVAAAAPDFSGFKLAKFKVEVAGYSKTVWYRSIEAENACETSDHSSGRERLTFATRKPYVITATYMPGDFNPMVFGRSHLGVPVEAKIRRGYTPVVAAPEAAGGCEDNGGGEEPVRPDCGSRTIRNWHVELEFSDAKKSGLQLHGDTSARNPYESCPTAPWTYPFLLDETDARKSVPLFANLSVADLFDPKAQKWITLGNGSYRESDDSFASTTTVHWAVSFTRLKGR